MNMPKLIASKSIFHDSNAQGERITLEEFYRFNGKISVSQFWHDMTTMKLVRVTSRELHPGEVIPNNGSFY